MPDVLLNDDNITVINKSVAALQKTALPTNTSLPNNNLPTS